jgi:proteic killer suppression protein
LRVILDFGDAATKDLFEGIPSKSARRIPQNLWTVARRKLDMLNAAQGLMDLTAPPANRLEALKGNWRGYHSIRVNDQFRVVFRWAEGHAREVQIIDYH